MLNAVCSGRSCACVSTHQRPSCNYCHYHFKILHFNYVTICIIYTNSVTNWLLINSRNKKLLVVIPSVSKLNVQLHGFVRTHFVSISGITRIFGLQLNKWDNRLNHVTVHIPSQFALGIIVLCLIKLKLFGADYFIAALLSLLIYGVIGYKIGWDSLLLPGTFIWL